MDWNIWIREARRGLSIAFTVAVIVNILALVQGEQVVWVGLLATLPLAFLLVTGLYLFVLPYATRSRRHGAPAEQASPAAWFMSRRRRGATC